MASARGIAVFAVVGAIVAWCSTGVAGAVTSFSMSPAAGLPGTVVHVSGSGCAPGLLASPATDFVTVTAPTLGVVLQIPVTSKGAWQSSFTVPTSGLAGLGSLAAPVTATCVSGDVLSLLTIYTPQTFTVTSPPNTSVPGPPTTDPPPGGSGGSGGTTTPPPPTPPVGTPPTSPGTPGSSPARGPSTTGPGSSPPTRGPGSAVGVPNTSGGTTAGNGQPAISVGTAAGAREVALGRKLAPNARAATLEPADLGTLADRGAGSGLGWLGWTLLVALVLAVAGAPAWLWRSRHRNELAETAGEPT